MNWVLTMQIVCLFLSIYLFVFSFGRIIYRVSELITWSILAQADKNRGDSHFIRLPIFRLALASGCFVAFLAPFLQVWVDKCL